MSKKVRFEEFFPSELDAAIAECPLAYVPCGSLEWHGEYLPVGCDYFRGEVICLRAAEITGGIVLPSMWVASAGYSAYRGSIVFSGTLVRRFGRELLRELEKMGFRLAVFVLGHAGPVQEEVFTGAVSDHAAEGGKMGVFAIAPPVVGGHAGPGEAGQCLVARPGSVDLGRFDAQATRLPKYEGLDPAPYQEGLSESGAGDVERHMRETTWRWDPTIPAQVTPEADEEAVQISVRGLVEAVQAKAAEIGLNLGTQ